MPPDDAVWACRLSGLSVAELWLRYLEIGGSRSMAEFAARLDGAAWPEPEEPFLAVVADEALREAGLPSLVSTEGTPGPFPAVGIGSDADDRILPRTTATAFDTRLLVTQLVLLFEQCARTRASARGVRQYARSVRRAQPVRGRPTPGSC